MLAPLSLALRSRRRRPTPWAELADLSGLPPEGLADAVRELARRGFVIESQPHLGLSLLDVPAALDGTEVAWDLPVSRIGCRLRCVETTTSTNDLAWEAVERNPGEADGLALFADYQSGGRGRRRSRWLAPPSSSVLCSVILWVPPGTLEGAVLTRMAAVAAAEAIEDQCDLPVGIKWPNDIVLEDRKVGGILVETRSQGGSAAPVVVGIGINCSQGPAAFPPAIRSRAASLAMLGAQVDRTLLARSLLVRLDRAWALATGPDGAAKAREGAARRCRTLGKQLTVTEGGAQHAGEVVDLDEEYGLVLRLAGGALRRFPAMTSHVVSEGGGPGGPGKKGGENAARS